jgi:hypothetical protein
MDFDFQPVDNLDVVPQQFRQLYADKAGADGKFVVAEPFKGVAEAVVGLGRALKSERTAAKNRPAPVDLSPLASYGDSVETIAQGMAGKIKDLEDQLAKGGKVNIDKIKADMAEAHKGEITKLTTRNTALQGQLYEHLVNSVAVGALAKERGSADLLLPIVRQSVKVAEEDGKISVYVVDASGDRRYSGVTGQPMSIGELVAEMKLDKRYARGFDSEAPSGGGMPPGSGKKPPITRDNSVPKSSIEKIKSGIAAGHLRRPTADDRR